MKQHILFVLIFLCTSCFAQENTFYTAARAGLNLREKPEPTSKVLAKIPYGTAIKLEESTDGSKRIVTEGFTGYWRKVNFNNQAGYITDTYLLPVQPPSADVKRMKDFLNAISKTHGDSLVIDRGNEEIHSRLIKQLYENGAEWQELQGYEYNSMTYFLPSFTIQQTFLLLRLLPELEDFIGEKDEFITSTKTIKKKDRDYQYKIEKEIFGDTTWIKRIKIEFEDGAIYDFEIFQIDDQVVVYYGAGV